MHELDALDFSTKLLADVFEEFEVVVGRIELKQLNLAIDVAKRVQIPSAVAKGADFGTMARVYEIFGAIAATED